MAVTSAMGLGVEFGADWTIIPFMNWLRRLAVGVAIPVLGLLTAGCGGFSGSHTVSPATFLLPGFMQTTPAPSPDAVAPAALPSTPILAQAR